MKDEFLIGFFVIGLFTTTLMITLISIKIGFEPMPGPAAGMPTMLGMLGGVGFVFLFIKFVTSKQLKSEENDC